MAQSLNQSLNLGAAPPAKRLMIALMGGAGLILLGGGGALVGLNSHLAALQTTAQQKQKEVDGSEGIAKRYVVTQAAYTETQSRIQCLETSVSAKSYVPTLLGQLQGLAATTHLRVLSVRPSAPPPTVAAPVTHPVAVASGAAPGPAAAPTPPPPPYDTMDIAVDVTGTYADTATFLYSLTRFPKIISVTSVQMHPDTQADKAAGALPPVATNLKLTAFMFHGDGADAPPAAGAAPAAGVLPPVTAGAVSAAAGRAAAGAVGATKAANARGAVGVGTL